MKIKSTITLIAAFIAATLIISSSPPARSQPAGDTIVCDEFNGRIVGGQIELSCADPAPTATATPTETNTPEPTETSAPSNTPTNTAVPPTNTPPPTPQPGHNVNTWHEQGVDFHGHGADRSTAHPDILAFLVDHPEYAVIGHAWESSPIENVFPFPGKHEGWKLIIENDTLSAGVLGPNQGDQAITDYLIWVHDMGTGGAYRTRIHSWKGVFRICDRATQSQCGITASGGWQDFGERHAAYKDTGCQLVDNPPYPPQHSVFGPDPNTAQPPYLTVNGTARQWLFWSGLVNPVIVPYLGHDHALLELAFSARPWQVPSLNNCSDPAFDVTLCTVSVGGNCQNNATRFQMWGLNLAIGQYPRPYNGFVDHWGMPVEGCEEGANCIRLIIEGGVPEGDADLTRHVRVGNGLYAPILNYDTGAEIHIPGHDD